MALSMGIFLSQYVISTTPTTSTGELIHSLRGLLASG